MKIDLTGDIPWYEILGILSFVVNIIIFIRWVFRAYYVDNYLSGVWYGDLLYTDTSLDDIVLRCTILFIQNGSTTIEGYLYYQRVNVRTNNALLERGLDKLHQVNGRVFWDNKLEINFRREFHIEGDTEINRNTMFKFDCTAKNILAKPKMHVKYRLHNGTFLEGMWAKG